MHVMQGIDYINMTGSPYAHLVHKLKSTSPIGLMNNHRRRQRQPQRPRLYGLRIYESTVLDHCIPESNNKWRWCVKKLYEDSIQKRLSGLKLKMTLIWAFELLSWRDEQTSCPRTAAWPLPLLSIAKYSRGHALAFTGKGTSAPLGVTEADLMQLPVTYQIQPGFLFSSFFATYLFWLEAEEHELDKS